MRRRSADKYIMLVHGPQLLLAAAAATSAVTRTATSQSLKMEGIFSDNMVLQSFSFAEGGEGARVAGSAAPGANISVTIGPYTASTTANASTGAWSVQLDAPDSGPFNATVEDQSGASLSFADVYFGPVFLCSGQSNMVYPLAGTANRSSELARADRPNVHLFLMPESTMQYPWADDPYPQPTANVSGSWTLSTNVTAAPFSAVCYLAVRDWLAMQGAEHSRHVGLVQAAKGGTPVEYWLPPTPSLFAACNMDMRLPIPQDHWCYTPGKCYDGQHDGYFGTASYLFNSMIAPWTHIKLFAVLWYQVISRH